MNEEAWRGNIDDGEWREHRHGERFQAFRKPLSGPAGGRALGASLYRLPPGKSAFPRHAHLANEEAIFILEGAGRLRLGEDEREVQAGDYIALPVGAEHAHALVNAGEADLVYLCLSTMNEPNVVLYPESDKVGAIAGSAPGGDADKRTLAAWFENKPVDYWQGEDGRLSAPIPRA